jgi:hypothetical protein
MSLKTPFRPKRFRKYHDNALESQLGLPMEEIKKLTIPIERQGRA